MECKICGKTDEETELFRGIFEEKIESVCSECARVENIPLIKKPNPESFEERRENLSVRQRMERMANPPKPIPKEHFIAHKNLAKLNFPTKREDHPELVENYDWVLKTARRRKKVTQTQMAEELIVPLQVIIDLESGKIAKDFLNYLDKIENFLGVKIRKKYSENFRMQRKPENDEEEKIVLESVRANMDKLGKGAKEKEMNLSDRKSLSKWTLRDLVNLKRKKESEDLLKAEKSEIVGDDLELEE